MSYIGESRKHTVSPWHSYVCLDEDDCRMLLKAVESLAKKKEKAYLKWIDIHDGGEMTERQQTAMMKAEDAYDTVVELQQNITEYLKYAHKMVDYAVLMGYRTEADIPENELAIVLGLKGGEK